MSPSTAASAPACASRATRRRHPARLRARASPSPSSFGKRSGTVTTAQFDDASLQRALRNAEEIAKVSPENPEAMPFLGPQTYAPVNGVLRRCGDGVARLARVVGRDRDRAQQEEGRRVGRLRRDAVGDAGRRELAGIVRLRPLHGRRLQPDGADAGQFGLGMGVEVVQRAAAAAARRARRDGDRQGGDGEESRRGSSPASTP